MPKAPEREPAPNSSRVRTVPFCAGTLNTKTLRDDFKLASLAISCAKLSQDLLLIQETHRNDSEDLTINHKHFSHWRFVGSGLLTGARAGVGILLSPNCQLISHSFPLPGRIIAAKVVIKGQKIYAVSAYAPDESYAESTKQAFWSSLNKCISGAAGFKVFLGGDFNATILPGQHTSTGRVFPRVCYERAKSTSFNGEQLLGLAGEQKLYVENTFLSTAAPAIRGRSSP